MFVLPQSEKARAAGSADTSFADQAVHRVYQPAAERFSQASAQLLAAAHESCAARTPAALDTLLLHYALAVGAFSELELYRVGPLLEENRQNRLFYWPDKRHVGERQMRALLADAAAPRLSGEDIARKSVTLQGFPALERLLFGKQSSLSFTKNSEAADCQVVIAIAENIAAMANAIQDGWQDDAPQVMSLLKPEAGSDFYRTDVEVLRGLVTQILIGLDVIQDRKLSALTGEQADIKNAPLWRSAQSVSMIRGNLESLRALSVDTGLANAADLEGELAFEFRSADRMLQQLQALPALTLAGGELTADAASLLRSALAVVTGIRYTLNDRFVSALGVSPGFNSEDGD